MVIFSNYFSKLTLTLHDPDLPDYQIKLFFIICINVLKSIL